MKHYLTHDWNCSCGLKFKNADEALHSEKANRHFIKVGATTRKRINEAKYLNATLGKSMNQTLDKFFSGLEI